MNNESKKYHGIITFLEIPLTGTEEEQNYKDLANYLMALGMSFEKSGKITKNDNPIQTYISLIKEDRKTWDLVEKTVLDVIKNYIKSGKKNGYDIEANKVCYGALKYLKHLYFFTKDAKATRNTEVNRLFMEIEKICEQTYNEVCQLEEITNPYNERHGSRKNKTTKLYDNQRQALKDRKYEDGYKNTQYKNSKKKKEWDRLNDEYLTEVLSE